MPFQRMNLMIISFYLENKGIVFVFKARWFVRPDINPGASGATIIYALVIPRNCAASGKRRSR